MQEEARETQTVHGSGGQLIAGSCCGFDIAFPQQALLFLLFFFFFHTHNVACSRRSFIRACR